MKILQRHCVLIANLPDKIWLICLLLAGIVGCGSTGHQAPVVDRTAVPARQLPPQQSSGSEFQRIVAALYAQHDEWRGAPYRYGGMSKQGVDCSGFIYLTYRDRLGLQLPRTTAAMARYGQTVPKKYLRPGDLVFFHTGSYNNQQHVGIYIEKDRFLHASTSRGVMISSLDNVYWSRNYWKAQRPPR